MNVAKLTILSDAVKRFFRDITTPQVKKGFCSFPLMMSIRNNS